MPTRCLSLILMSMLLFAASAGAQRQNVLKINPLSLGLGTLNLQYERVMGKRWSLQAAGFLGATKAQSNEAAVEGAFAYKWLGATAEARFHANYDIKENPRGLYFAPYLRFRAMQQAFLGLVKDLGSSTAWLADLAYRRHAWGGGVIMGYQLISSAGFVFDAFAGPQFSLTQTQVKIDCESCDGNEAHEPVGLDFKGLEFRVGLALGWAF